MVTTWPCLTWADIEADMEAIESLNATAEQPNPLGEDNSDVSSSDEHAKIRILATDIFHVHANLSAALGRMRCNASLIRVIQTYLMVSKMDPNEPSTKAIALEWLQANAPDWAIDTSDLDQSALLECIRDDVCHAESREELLKHLASAAHDSIAFPVTTHLPPVTSSILGHVPTVTTTEAYQDAKDIQRDQIHVNGVVYPGVVGYDSLIAALTRVIENVHAQFREASKTPQYEALAKRILHTINRTESGGSSYEILSHLMPSIALLRPNSKDAGALGVHIDVGPYERDGPTREWCLGLRVRLSTTTSYVVCDAKDPTDEWCSVAVCYESRLAFAFGDSPYTAATQGSRMDDAVVRLSMVA
ncbi:hypothetical protein ACHHYP_10469 [Achlya hypogyna]|uniref:Uncharacterized protein n=1 Tax=Achlya hypogyna TaxID=1202772 RepID=A0A1V9YLC6_ACHHY|nr:hypothetical protein ACHHYP_10469 [Achlya hypogyna]